jgi:hypothetical protein
MTFDDLDVRYLANTLVAALHLPPDVLAAELAEGRSLTAIAREKKISLEQLHTLIAARIRSNIQAAQSAQVISQAKAEFLISKTDERTDQIINKRGLELP